MSSQTVQMNLFSTINSGIKTGKVIYLEVFGMGKGKEDLVLFLKNPIVKP